MAKVVLHQFPFSHYNEKARWALDWKGIAHQRISHLPGPHMAAMRKLSGQTSTPVLVIDGETIAGSDLILAALDERFPDSPALLPPDPAQREAALAVQSRFDRDVGPAVRTLGYSVMLPEGGYVRDLFAKPHPLPKRLFYRLIFPTVSARIAKFYRAYDRDFVSTCSAVVSEAFDYVADESRDSGFIVGDQFSLADLTCAALLAPLVALDHPDMVRPQPVPATIAALSQQFANHPGADWVRMTYTRHRPTGLADPRASARSGSRP